MKMKEVLQGLAVIGTITGVVMLSKARDKKKASKFEKLEDELEISLKELGVDPNSLTFTNKENVERAIKSYEKYLREAEPIVHYFYDGFFGSVIRDREFYNKKYEERESELRAIKGMLRRQKRTS